MTVKLVVVILQDGHISYKNALKKIQNNLKWLIVESPFGGM